MLIVGCVIIISLPLGGVLSYLPLSAPLPRFACLQPLPEDEKVVALHTSAKHFSFFFFSRGVTKFLLMLPRAYQFPYGNSAASPPLVWKSGPPAIMLGS